ncbi:hypothetical protein MK805_07550 [Shimazuella sp. AN120528]|uniref:hypothetical protein n=1 Tax=Shimazuella soli TaxID=1892854 RepID=UPI001F0DEA08|nr:hypothetical protein [Shimazuella soli]MCH5584827.1 hypothetical protein [Shimazuella soli]
MRKLINEDYSNSRRILESTDCVEIKLKKLLASKINFFTNFSVHFSLESAGGMKDFIEDMNYRDAMLNLIEEGKKEGIFIDSITTKTMMAYLDIIRYYFIHNVDSISIFDNNSETAEELYSLFFNALLKK